MATCSSKLRSPQSAGGARELSASPFCPLAWPIQAHAANILDFDLVDPIRLVFPARRGVLDLDEIERAEHGAASCCRYRRPVPISVESTRHGLRPRLGLRLIQVFTQSRPCSWQPAERQCDLSGSSSDL